MQFEELPEFPLFLLRFGAAVHRQENAGNRHHHGQVVEHIRLEFFLLGGQAVQVHLGDHQFGDPQLLVHPLDHDLFVDALVLPADEITVEVQVHVIELLAAGQRQVDKDVVHIEGVLGQAQAAVPQDLRAVDDAVHQDILALGKMADLGPGEGAVHRQHTGIPHRMAGVVHRMFVDIVAQQQVHRGLHGGKGPQFFHDFGQGVGVQPVVGVHHLEVDPPGVADALVHPFAVAAVLLMDDPDDVGVFFRPGVRNGAGLVLGTVIHQDDLGVLPRGQQGLDTAVHIGRRVITRHGEGNQFHGILSSSWYGGWHRAGRIRQAGAAPADRGRRSACLI